MIQVIRTETEFKNLKTDWNKLYGTIDQTTPYQTWSWNFLYWKHFSAYKKLCILLFKQKGLLKGIAPLWVRDYENLKIVEPIGSRGTDYIDILICKNSKRDIFSKFIKWFETSDIDLLNIEDLPHTNLHTNKYLDILESKNLYLNQNPIYCPCYSIKLENSWEHYLESISRRIKNDIYYYRRYATKHFKKVNYRQASSSEISKHFELHQKIRTSKGDRGTYDKTSVRNFIKEYAINMENNNLLKLVFLSFDGRDVASILGVEWNKERYNITIGYDPKYSKYRPGTLLYTYDIENCIGRGITKYDLSRGSDLYKLTLGAKQKYNVRLVISRSKRNNQLYLKKQRIYWKNSDYAPTER
ncbi:MAG: cellulose biosynthesis protein [uncultured bacterium]|nr:MAG: cellulose biosynthesis protein [uncultured bacterium]